MMRGLCVGCLVLAGVLATTPQDAVAQEAITELDAEAAAQPAPFDEDTVVVAGHRLRAARRSLLTSLVVAGTVVSMAAVTAGLLVATFVALMMLPQALPGLSLFWTVRQAAPMTTLILWVPIITVAGTVAGASLGVGSAEFLGLTDENLRGPVRAVLPPALGMVAGVMAAALAVSSGVLFFMALPGMMYRPGLQMRSYGATTEETASASPQLWLQLVPAVVLSSVAGVAALGLTHLTLGTVGARAVE